MLHNVDVLLCAQEPQPLLGSWFVFTSDGGNPSPSVHGAPAAEHSVLWTHHAGFKHPCWGTFGLFLVLCSQGQRAVTILSAQL